MLMQQMLILSVFVLALWLLPNNYIEKSISGRCQPSIQQQSPHTSKIFNAPEDLASMRFDDGRHGFILNLESCENFVEPILVIETIWLNEIVVKQQTMQNSFIVLKEINTGGRFYTYTLDNLTESIALEASPLMDLKFNLAIWEKQQYQKTVTNLLIYFSIIFSAFITLLIINIIIYLQSQDEDYLRYLPFLFTNILFLGISEGAFHVLGWKPDLSAVAPLWWVAALSGFFGIRFIITFTSMEKYFPVFTKYYIRYPSYLYLVACIITLFDLSLGAVIIRVTILWMIFITWFALIRMLKFNNFGIVYIFLAWSALTLGVAARTLYGLDIIGLSSLVIYGVVIGSLFETLLLSLSLGYKIVQFREGQQFQLSQALTDVLTDLPNRRHLDGVGKEIFTDFNETDISVCVAMIDCDKFKEINDNYGHEIGDHVLQVISRKIRTALRGNDIVGRWGGEEFLCFLPDVTEATVDIVMTRLLDGISEYNIQVDEHSIKTSVSIGLTFLNNNDNSMTDALRRADQALYQAKQNGRACQVTL